MIERLTQNNNNNNNNNNKNKIETKLQKTQKLNF